MKETDFLWKNATTAVVAALVSGISVGYFTLFQREQAADLTERVNAQIEKRLTELEIELTRQNSEIERISHRMSSLDYVVKSSSEVEYQLQDLVSRLEQIQSEIGERQ